MNSASQRLVLALALLAGASALHAAVPTISLLKADQVLLGETMALRAELVDPDGNLQSVSVLVMHESATTWQLIGTNSISGASAVINRTWTPTEAGAYAIRFDVNDTLGEANSSSLLTQVFTERVVVQALNMVSGNTKVVFADGEVRTKENPAAAEVVTGSGADLVFWAQSRIVLKPGFRASAGTKFWGAIDTNSDGYSDMEETIDLDGDGVPDAWERDRGNRINYATGVVMTPSMAVSSGYTNGNVGGSSLPPGYGLVLRLPGNRHAGVRTSENWEIASITIP